MVTFVSHVDFPVRATLGDRTVTLQAGETRGPFPTHLPAAEPANGFPAGDHTPESVRRVDEDGCGDGDIVRVEQDSSVRFDVVVQSTAHNCHLPDGRDVDSPEMRVTKTG